MQFKILMHGKEIVNPATLHKGIYTNSEPIVYNKDKTMISLRQDIIDAYGMLNRKVDFTAIHRNLDKCHLQLVEMKLINSEQAS